MTEIGQGRAMTAEGLSEVRFAFDFDGARVVIRD